MFGKIVYAGKYVARTIPSQSSSSARENIEIDNSNKILRRIIFESHVFNIWDVRKTLGHFVFSLTKPVWKGNAFIEMFLFSSPTNQIL